MSNVTEIKKRNIDVYIRVGLLEKQTLIEHKQYFSFKIIETT